MRIPPTVKRALRLFTVFLLGTGFANLITFLALPVYTRLVPPDAFGYFDLSLTYITIVAALLYADVWVGVMRFSLSDSAEAPRAIRIGLQFFLLSSLMMLLVALVVWFIFEPVHMWLILGLGVARSLANFWSFSTRGLGGEKAFAFSGVINAIVSFGGTVAFLMLAHTGVSGLYLGMIIGCLAQVVFLEARFRLLSQALRVPTDHGLRSRLAWFALPLSLNSVAFWVFTGFGRIIVSWDLGLEANGVFAAASKLAGIVTVMANILTLVWQQLAFERGRGDARFFERGNAVSAAVYSIGGMISVPVGVILYQLLVDPRYANGWSTVPLFMAVAAMAGYSSFVGNIFYVTERTSSLFWSALACMAVVLIATVPLVQIYGLNGANLALVFGYAVNILVKHVLLKKSDSVSAPLSILVLGAAGCALTVASVFVLTVSWSVAVAVALIFVFVFWSWRSGFGSHVPKKG